MNIMNILCMSHIFMYMAMVHYNQIGNVTFNHIIVYKLSVLHRNT